MRRLALGLALLALTSSVLLLSDWSQRQQAAASASPRPAAKKWKLYFVQLNNVLDVEESEQGVREGLL